MNDIVEQLIAAIDNSGRSLTDIAKKSGVNHGQLSKLVNRQRTLNLTSAAKVAAELGLSLEVEGKPKATYYRSRDEVDLATRIPKAKDHIQILTTTLTVNGSLPYLGGILAAVGHAREQNRQLEVTVLASHPDNPFLRARAEQLKVDFAEYRRDLEQALNVLFTTFAAYPECQLLTYQDFPIQLWYRVDGTIYVGIPSIGRRARNNCFFALPVERAGVRETFLDHFEALRTAAKPFREQSRRGKRGRGTK